MKPWSMGFLGALTNDACIWLSEYLPEEIQTIGVPFLGSAKAVTLMTREDRIIESWDTQYVVRAMVDGIFTAKEPQLTVTEPRLRKGYVYDTRCYKGIPDQAAGLIDYIAYHGSHYERIALTTAIIRSTFAGRMHDWSESATATALWEKFQKRLTIQEPYLNMPGKWYHREDNFFDTTPGQYDLLYVDPPKIITNSDVYSDNFEKLNRSIGVEPRPFDRWTRYDFVGKIRMVLETKSDWLIFIYTSDVRPTLEEVMRVLDEYGDLKENRWFQHRKRFDYVLVYDRR